MSHDKHFAVFSEPATGEPPAAAMPPVQQRERLNFGFGKLERLRGNVGYLELRNFSDFSQQSAKTASALLSTLANFDAIILDLRRNSGGNLCRPWQPLRSAGARARIVRRQDAGRRNDSPSMASCRCTISQACRSGAAKQCSSCDTGSR